jgi:DNA polymerase-3 subunit epsilon
VDDRHRIALVFAGWVTVVAMVAALVGLWGDGGVLPHLATAAAAFLALAALWYFVDRAMRLPASTLAEAVETLLRNPGRAEPFPYTEQHSLGRLPDAVYSLAEALRTHVLDYRRELSRAESRVEERRDWLAVALRDLSEAVLVCDLQHRILFRNAAAERVIGCGKGLAEGQVLDTRIPGGALDHGLTCLRARWEALRHLRKDDVGAASFVCRTRDGRTLQGRMSLVRGGKRGPGGYVVALRDLAEEWAALEPREVLRNTLTRDLRGPLGALRAAAETLADFPEMAAADRGRFVAAITHESLQLSRRIESLAAGSADTAQAAWPVADIHFAELFACIAGTLESRLDLKLTMVGIPLWLRGDSQSLMEAFLALFASLHIHTGCREFDLECMLGDRMVYVDINWLGTPVADARLAGWLDADVNTALGPQRARDVLERHGSEPWSLAKRGGFAALRVPLPLPRRPQFREEDILPPEHSAPRLDVSQLTAGDFRGKPLRRVPYVVIHPGLSQGGEMAVLGAVLMDGGRTTTAGTIECRPEALASFAGNAAVAVHDAAACLSALGGGSVPVVDTMTISRLLDPDEDDHSLEAAAARLHIVLADRRTEVGRALVTAELLSRQLERLGGMGIERFEQLMDALAGASLRDVPTGPSQGGARWR